MIFNLSKSEGTPSFRENASCHKIAVETFAGVANEMNEIQSAAGPLLMLEFLRNLPNFVMLYVYWEPPTHAPT